MEMAIKKIKRHLKIIICIFAFLLLVFFNGSAVAQKDTSIVSFPTDTMKQEKLPMFYITYDYTDVFYSKWLVELNEPPLNEELDCESYRFTWKGSFGTEHNPFSVRIENQ